MPVGKHPNGEAIVDGERPPFYTADHLEYLFEKGWLVVNDTACCIWKGGTRLGRPKLNVEGNSVNSARYVMRISWYQQGKGEIPSELFISPEPHRAIGLAPGLFCCNPDHNELVSRARIQNYRSPMYEKDCARKGWWSKPNDLTE